MLSSPLIHSETATVSGGNSLGTAAQSAGPDSIVQATAEAQGLQLVAPENLPPFGTFWEVMPFGLEPPLPCPLFDSSLPVYAITDNSFLVDATGGQGASPQAANLRQSAAASMAGTSAVNASAPALATAVANLINQVQTAQANRQAGQQAQSTMMASDSLSPPWGLR